MLSIDGLQTIYENRESNPLGKLIANSLKLVAEAALIQPTIIYEFPTAVSPLSKQKPDDPDWVERFEFYLRRLRAGQRLQRVERSGRAAQALCPAA